MKVIPMRRFTPLLTQPEIDRALARSRPRTLAYPVLPWGEALIGMAFLLLIRSLG